MQFSLSVSWPQPDGSWAGVILKASLLPFLILSLKRLRQMGLEQLLLYRHLTFSAVSPCCLCLCCGRHVEDLDR